MSEFSTASVGVLSRAKTPKFLDHPQDLTTNFGLVHVANIQEVNLGDSELDNYSVHTLVRFSDLVAPTFGKIQTYMTHTIVKQSDLYPYYAQVLANLPVRVGQNDVIPIYFPHCSSFDLTIFSLVASHSTYVAWVPVGTEGTRRIYGILDKTTFDQEYQAILNNAFTTTEYASSLIHNNCYYRDLEDMSPSNADLSIQFTYKGELAYLSFYFKERTSKQLFRTLRSIEFRPTLNVLDGTNVRLLRLFAVYKAYFDNFMVAQYENYQTSALFKLQQYYQTHLCSGCGVVTTPFDEGTEAEALLVIQVLRELSNMVFTEDIDFISAHQSAQLLPAASKNIYNYGPSYINEYGPNTPISRFTFGNQQVFLRSDVNFTQLDDILLKKLYISTNRQSQDGFRLRTELQNRGYGSWADDIDSTYVGREVGEVQIETVTSMSDTLSQQGSLTQGTGLGSYGARAQKFEEGHKYKIHVNEPSYVVSLYAINPVSGYPLGMARDWYGYDAFSAYNPEYDGFGMEPSPRSVLGKNDVLFNRSKADDKQTFGYIPRYSGYRQRQPILSGDFARQAFSKTYSPYQLEKRVSGHRLASTPSETIEHGFSITPGWSENVPNAGLSWRRPSLSPWMSNYNRIFRNSRDNVLALDQNIEADINDNIIVQHYVTSTLYDRMLPSQDTWQATIEGETGKSVQVSKE